MSDYLIDDEDLATKQGQDSKKELKNTILDKLKDHDWMDRMRLNCRSYIANNGTKIISAEEIRDFLMNEALKSFPKSIKEEMADHVKSYIETFEEQFNHSSNLNSE